MKTERLKASDMAKIYKLWNEYAAAINDEDTERWSALWCNNAVRMPPDAPQSLGKEQIQKLSQFQIDHFHTKLSINPEVVCILGDKAYTYGTFTSVATPKQAAHEGEFQRNGKFLTILEKQADGSWKILIDCYNYGRLEAGGGR